MPTITRLEELQIWQLAREYSKTINLLLRSVVFDEERGLKQQMKNASGSVMDNIAEGFGRASKNEFVNHLSVAKGSLEETRSQLYRCLDQRLISEQDFDIAKSQSEQLIKQTTGLMNYLNRSSIKGPKFKNRQ